MKVCGVSPRRYGPGYQHGVSIPIAINLSKTFPWISNPGSNVGSLRKAYFYDRKTPNYWRVLSFD